MLHFKEKIYQICGCIAGILFAIFGFINAAGLRGTGLEKIYIISFNVVYGCIIFFRYFSFLAKKRAARQARFCFLLSLRALFPYFFPNLFSVT